MAVGPGTFAASWAQWVECDNSVRTGHREERETPDVPKENDFFVVPRSDELLAAEASTKPELIELSAGDSWQHAMALVRRLSVTVGLGMLQKGLQLFPGSV